MEAKELQLGDLVKYKTKLGMKLIGKVTHLYNDGLYTGVTVDSHFCDRQKKEKEFDNIQPIPLTPEIFEKNGWSFDGGYFRYELSDGKWLEYYKHESRLRMWWEGIDEWQNHAKCREILFQCQCSYVHELQHALRLCGIEKSIVL